MPTDNGETPDPPIEHRPICWTGFTPETKGGNKKRYCSPPRRVEDWRRNRQRHTEPNPASSTV